MYESLNWIVHSILAFAVLFSILRSYLKNTNSDVLSFVVLVMSVIVYIGWTFVVGIVTNLSHIFRTIL